MERKWRVESGGTSAFVGPKNENGGLLEHGFYIAAA